MTTTFSFLIRDGLESDIPRCLALDHSYETEHVWQMNTFEEPGSWQISFKRERLPRVLPIDYPANERRIRAALPDEHCFLVAIARDTDDVIGYLTMRNQPPHRLGLVQDIVVGRPHRGGGIGSRLLNIARKWAREHDLEQITVEVQTKNYPGICFCQNQGLAFCGFNDRYFLNRDIAIFFSQSLR